MANDGAFEPKLRAHAALVEARLDALLAREGRPPRLVDAMRHAMLGGGKRLRPFLVIESASLFGLEPAAALEAAVAVELVHGYSLVHDDLPAMDNDDMRRGRPTVHVAYDEATAILAGDALLTLAFAVLASPRASSEPVIRGDLVAALAEAAGLDGMVGGQMLDLAAEGRFDSGTGGPHALGLADVAHLQRLKTGAIIRFAAEAGAILAGKAASPERAALTRYGEALGLAFQIKDDLLDHEGDEATVGKRLAKDAAAGKATFVSLLGVEPARARLAAASEEGQAALVGFGPAGSMLAQVLLYNSSRAA